MRSVREIAVDAFDCVRAMDPPTYRRLHDTLKTCVLTVRIDEEQFAIRCRMGTVEVVDDVSQPAVSVSSSIQTILQLIDGSLMLERAVLTDALHVRGTIVAVPNALDALVIFVRGLLGSRRAPGLLDELECHDRNLRRQT